MTTFTDKPESCFRSTAFQDYLGVDKTTGTIKGRNEWVHTINWDLVIFDEYHFGAWKENAKKLFEQDDEDDYDSENMEQYSRADACDETWLPITTDHYLYLSGTPFHALNSGEFIEEQIYNWTYSDEQRAKENWQGEHNPYAALPRMVMMTYKIPESIQQIAKQGEYDEFDLNVFFSAKGKGRDCRFVYEDYVQKWLDLIRGSYLETTVDELKLGAKKPALPFADSRLLNVLQHTLWFLPNVASCYAMANLLADRKNTFYHDYKINVCAGTEAGIGAAALEPVQRSMGDPLETKTITLSCGKLTTGVTVKPWTGIFMLRNLSSPETYFQAAFRVQSPWEVTTDKGQKEIIKKECYVFDFALNRALRQISDYSCRLNIHEGNPEKKVAEFINFLPVIAYDGSSMRQINAGDILDIAMAGTSATLLAKRWESVLLVNVDNETLSRLIANKDAMDALMKIEGFRSLNSDIETIIAKSEKVKKAKKEGTKDLTPKQKKELSDEEKEYKSKRKQIQEKLIKFATRIPVFMYLTDYRERCLKDVITQLEPGLFKKVTGLSVKDFELLVSLGVFNDSLMNDAVYKFKRYEDASLSYTGIDRHEGEDRGGWDTVLSDADYNKMFTLQQASMEKRGVETFLGNLNRDIRAANSLMQSIRSAIRGLQRWIADLNEKKQLLLDALEKSKEPTLSDLLVDYFNLRNEQRSDWSGKAKLKYTVRDFEEVKWAVDYLKAHSLNTVEDLNQAIDSLNQTAAPLRRQLKQNENRMRAIAQIKDVAAVHAKLKPIHDAFMKKNFKLTKDAYAAQHKEELDTFNKAVRTLMKLNGSTAVDFSALDAEFSALQSGSAELRTKLETLQPDVSALKNIRKYIDMVLNKQQLSAPGGKTPEKESVLKRLNDSKVALEQKKLQPQQKATEHTL